MDDVRRALRLRQGWVNLLVAARDLEWAAVKQKPLYTTDLGVTRASLEPEIRWWQSASTGERLWRRIKLLVRISV